MGEGEEDDGLYELEEKTILSITPDNAMTVNISVDELDILQYQTGMQADVTVDALPDRSFTAEVEEISPLGENSGGNSKFQVRLQLDRAPDMLDGMNASVVVHGGRKTALLLPAAAIHDRGSKSYVYTALDSKTGKPTLELAVTTGLSDGEKVEILTGLTENQPVFYEYYTGPES
ncbi:MAG: HlyD family efflux transporter periplasmic adaptor subunit [Candidatus Limivicinus sp.]